MSRLYQLYVPLAICSVMFCRMVGIYLQSKRSEVKEEGVTRYKTYYLVCDTCALMDDPGFFEKLLKNGRFSGFLFLSLL